jgi:hypothetical protein
MRDRAIVIIFFGLLIVAGLFVTGTIFGVLIGIVGLLLMGIVWALTQSREKPYSQTDEEIQGFEYLRKNWLVHQLSRKPFRRCWAP